MSKTKALSKKDKMKAAVIQAKIDSLRQELNLLLTIPMPRLAPKSEVRRAEAQ